MDEHAHLSVNTEFLAASNLILTISKTRWTWKHLIYMWVAIFLWEEKKKKSYASCSKVNWFQGSMFKLFTVHVIGTLAGTQTPHYIHPSSSLEENLSWVHLLLSMVTWLTMIYLNFHLLTETLFIFFSLSLFPLDSFLYYVY